MLRIVKTENGVVEGIPAADPRITAFKGIPFAAPPIGENRWRAPQKAENWDGVKKCYKFAPIAMQEIPGENPDNLYSREWHVDPEIKMSEDCLYLNIWSPAKCADENLPVMIWIFGGGYQCGYPAEMEFDGERLARRGVILVSLNYRLNTFGFLTHPELMKEDPDGCYGNYGLLDQKFGIEWVKRNIAAFGGNPDNITIFGQSAGAGSVSCQMVSPLTKGLFQRVITQSGGGLRKYGQGSKALDFDLAIENGKRFFEFLGVKSLEEARKIDEKTLRDKALKFGTLRVWEPTIDGRFLPDDPSDMLYRNEYHDVDVLIGNNGGEHDFGVLAMPKDLEGLRKYAELNLGKYKDEFLSCCGAKTDAEAADWCKNEDVFIGRCVSDLLFLQNQAKYNRKPAYTYYFNPSFPGFDNPGAFHSSELWFVFETLAKCWRPFKGKHYDLARKMCNYWTNFAKTGDPNGTDADGEPMPQWRKYTLDDPFILFLSEEGIAPYKEIMTKPMKLRIKKIFEDLEK